MTLDLGTDEDTGLTVTAAAMVANDGGGAASITDVSANAVDSSGTIYGTITHAGGAGYNDITFTPNAEADALAEGQIKDVYFTYTNNLGVTNTVKVRIGGLDNDPTDSNASGGTPVITGAGHRFDLDTTTAQMLELIIDMIVGGNVHQNESKNSGNSGLQGMGGYNEFTTSTGWTKGTYTLGATPNRNQVVVLGNAADMLDLINDGGIWTDVGNVSDGGGQTYYVYNHSNSNAQVIVGEDVITSII